MENFKEKDNNNYASPKNSDKDEESPCDNEEEFNRENEVNNDSNRDENSYQENQDFMRKYIFKFLMLKNVFLIGFF